MKEWADSGDCHQNEGFLQLFAAPFQESFVCPAAGGNCRPLWRSRLLEVEITEKYQSIRKISIPYGNAFGLAQGNRFKLAIDDFGAGYSSLGLLEQLDVDVIRLTRSFIRSESKKKRGDCCARVVAIASELSMDSARIGNKEQADMLVRVGCLSRTKASITPARCLQANSGSVFTARSKTKIRSKGPPVPMGAVRPFSVHRFLSRRRDCF